MVLIVSLIFGGNFYCFSFSDETSSTNGTNILTELSSALNRLQATLLEEKDVVTDTRKRNTILTLVAWLKRVLQTSSNDNTAIDALTDLLPTELLLSKLMPQLSDADKNGIVNGAGESATLDRSNASSKRFSRQRNKRFNTVGVSREELADARLYLQKKLLSENLASSGTSSSSGHASMEHQNILDDDPESRRKSLNLQFDNDLNADLDHILEKGRSSFSKSIDIVPPVQRIITVATALPTLDAEPKVVLRRKVSAPLTDSHQRQPFNGNGQRHNGRNGDKNVNPNSDTEDDAPDGHSHAPNGGVAARPMNKFSLRKLKMKRANTIDVPKSQPLDDLYACSDENATETSVYSNASSVNGVRRAIQAQCNPEVDKNHVPPLQVKTTGDQKYLAFLNKQNNENRLSWMNPGRGSVSPQGKVAVNWSNKFGNIKNSFERIEPPVSPGLAKKNNFTHAPTSPFMPVHSSKPPQIPNGHSQQYHQTHQVSQKIAAIHSSELAERQPFEQRPQLKSHKSLPSDARSPTINGRNATKWSNKFASADAALEHVPTSFNPLYVPLHQSTTKQAPLPPRSPSKTPVSPFPQHGEFPAYTYTCTDYTRPTCVSTFGPEKSTSPVKTQILPDNSYIKNQSPQRSLQPSLGTAKLSKNMRTVEYTSSSECLSESNSSYRSPHPFATNRIYADNSYSDAKTADEQEFMATSQIMRYPESQTATMIVNKTKRYDQDEERVAKNLHSFLTNNVHAKPQLAEYPASDPHFSHVNKTYVPAAAAGAPNAIRNNVSAHNKFNNFVSMENLSYQQKPTQPPATLKSAVSTHGLNAQSFSSKSTAATSEQKFTAAKAPAEKPKPSQVIKVNSYGSQYMPPKVLDPAFDGTPFRIQKKDHAIMNNISGLNRSNTIVHRRPPPIEIKRKQSLPGQGTDYASMIDAQTHSPPSHDHDHDHDDDDTNQPRHNYLPAGILKRSKSGHTLALLQQFENKERTNGTSMPQPPLPSQPLKSALKQTFAQAPKPALRSNPIESKPIDVVKPSSAPVPVPQPSPNHLDAPKITETPSSPIVDEERIIYPGQTSETRNKIKNYAQTLNAMHSRKTTINSAAISEEIVTGASTGPARGILQKSKSGTLLSIPKPFESLNRADAEEKQRTVAAYFAGAKSPQGGLQRSASQHSVLSSSSTKSLKTSNENIDINGNNTETVDRTTSKFESSAITTNTKSTTKSAHHLKILKKQQKQSATNALPLAKSQTMPHISSVNLLDESNVDDAFEDLFLSFNK